jgi:hypothetical protein
MVKAKKVRPRIGRPPVADADRRDTSMHVLMTEAEQKILQRAAADASMSASTWVRVVALERARTIATRKDGRLLREQAREQARQARQERIAASKVK